jgi:hypothetical protein
MTELQTGELTCMSRIEVAAWGYASRESRKRTDRCHPRAEMTKEYYISARLLLHYNIPDSTCRASSTQLPNSHVYLE